MKISAKCLTYGRVDTLEETLHSFLTQEWDGKKELIIVNDYPLQTLIFDHPEVKIYNLDRTFPVIGEKENFTIERCSGDVIAVHDDDDLAMPWHLQNIEEWFKEDTDLLHWKRGVYSENNKVKAITGIGNSGIVFSRKAYDEVRGYPLENAGHDMSFVFRIREKKGANVVFATPDRPSWWYRWAFGETYHCSGMGTDTPDRPNIIERHTEHIEYLRKQGKIPTGIIHLQPHWKKDYVSLLKKYMEK